MTPHTKKLPVWGDICRDVRKPEILGEFPTQVPTILNTDDPFDGKTRLKAAAARAARVISTPAPEHRWPVLEPLLLGVNPPTTFAMNLNLLLLVRLILSKACQGRPLDTFDDLMGPDSSAASRIPQELDAIREAVEAIHAELNRLAPPISDKHT